MQIVGRRSSLYTRVVLIFAEELGVPFEFVPIHDMTTLEPEAYAGNPALKLPILRSGGSELFGTQNICRAIAERADRHVRIVWPEELEDDLSRNANELLMHAMAAQVQLVVGTLVGKLPADNVYFAKARAGLEGSLSWLDANLTDVLQILPKTRDLSLFEVSLFCLIEHLAWRGTMMVDQYGSLITFARAFAVKSAAQRTTYLFDAAGADPHQNPTELPEAQGSR